MRTEIAAAARQAAIEREQTREQAALDRQHSAEEAHKERLTLARREVYLDATNALGKAQLFLGSLAKQDFRTLDYEGNIGPLTVAVNKIAVIGEIETVKTARDLAAKLNTHFIQALASLQPAQLFRSQAEQAHARWETSQIEIKRILAAMANHNESGQIDSNAFAALTRSFETQQTVAKEAADDEQEAGTKYAMAQVSYGRSLMKATTDLAHSLDLLANCMRVELGIKTNFKEFHTHTDALRQAASESTSKALADIAQFQADAKAGKYDERGKEHR